MKPCARAGMRRLLCVRAQSASRFFEVASEAAQLQLTIIDEVVSRRYNAMGCTLATTNYVPGNPTGAAPPNLSTTQASGQTLGDRVGDRVYSRLLQLVDFVEVAGRDYRGPAVH